MTDETIKTLRDLEKSLTDDASLLDASNIENQKNILSNVEKTQKIELDERRMRLEELKQQLECDKFEYQKKQDKNESIIKVVCQGLTFLGIALPVGLKLWFQRKYVKEAYNIEQITTIASPTARSLLKDGTNPRI